MNCYSSHLELRLSLHLAIKTRLILHSVRVQRGNGFYIWVSEIPTGRLDQSLWTLNAAQLAFFWFLRTISSQNMKNLLSQRTNNSIIGRFWGRSSSLFFVLPPPCSTVENSWFVRKVRCSKVILSSVHKWWTTLKRFHCTGIFGPIGQCVKHQNCHLEKGSHCHCNWGTIGYTSNTLYLWQNKMWWGDGNQNNIWVIEWFEPQKASSGL